MATRFSQALSNFKFPKEIKNDIIYCQRALRSHIKVHQMIVDQYSKEKEFCAAKQACLDELENEIYEINCEQQYLLLRIRRIIDEFFKSLQREDIGVDRLLMNDHVSRQLVPLIQNKDYICEPTVARIRFTESQLIETYLLSDNWKTINKSPTPPAEVPPPPPPEPPTPAVFNAKQVSLLKPISERVVKPAPSQSEIIIPDEVKPKKPPSPTSSKVRLSRMNLRQALNKAALAINVAPPQPIPVVSVAAPRPTKPVVEVTKKPQQKPLKSDPSSSEESIDARVPTPPHLDMKTMPDDYTQESFMRLFNLFTRDTIQQMQQRRSKRKRRCVHNNEKTDYHYGRIEHMLSPQAGPSKKRKKEFLLSPRVNRALKKKRSSDADRSNSSSPDEKEVCNECLKPSGVVIQCKECPGSYHEICHKDMNIKTVPGQCPSCSRLHYNAMLQEEAEKKNNTVLLRGQYRELEQKLVLEQQRREKLRQESKRYKIGMTNLFNIVETIKTDENDG